MFQALIVGLIAGTVVGLFRFGIDKTSAFWLYLFKQAHKNSAWFIAIVIGLAAVGIIAGYFVKQYPHVGGSGIDRKSTRLNSSHVSISYAVFCLKKKIITTLSFTSKMLHTSF